MTERKAYHRARRGKSFWGERFCRNALPRPLPKNSYMAGGTFNAHVDTHGHAANSAIGLEDSNETKMALFPSSKRGWKTATRHSSLHPRRYADSHIRVFAGGGAGESPRTRSGVQTSVRFRGQFLDSCFRRNDDGKKRVPPHFLPLSLCDL